MCPEPTFVQFFYVLNLMLVNVKWASVAQQLVHDVSKKDVYCLFEALIYKQCMVHIWAPCTVNSGLCGLRLCVVFTQIICIVETETVQIYIGAISWCFEPSSLHTAPCWPLLPDNWYISTFAQPPYAFRSRALCISIVFLLLYSSAGDLEESMTTQHSSAIGD